MPGIQSPVTFFEKLIADLGPFPHSPLGPKPTDPNEIEARQREAARLTSLLEGSPRFSFVRLGDMDLALLLAAQEGESFPEYSTSSSGQTGTQPAGGPGISLQHAARLRGAIEKADYVDWYQRIYPVGPLLPRLKINPKLGQECNPDKRTSLILLTWVEREFRAFCERHRCGFAGGEVAVLENLVGVSAFQEAAKSIWPSEGEQFFHRPREDGAKLDENLDLIKEDLKKFVDKNRIDTLFISMGGGAKILAQELAEELSIRCIDFGAMLRALCYLGSRGDRAGRATHAPFFYRLDFHTVMDAIEKTFPFLSQLDLMSKAHAQLILESQRKETGWTHASWEIDNQPENIKIFLKAKKEYSQRFRHINKNNDKISIEIKRFLHFCGTHRLSWEGRFYLTWFKLKENMVFLLKRSQS